MSEWINARISEICDIEYGKRITKKKDAGTIFPVYGGGGETFRTDAYNREDRLVVSRFGMSERCTRFVKGRFFLNDSGLTLSPLSATQFDTQFLNYLVFSLNDEIYSLGKGTAQKNLDVDAFRNIECCFPHSLPEQKRIVAILDEAFGAIERAKEIATQNVASARELFDSYLNRVFTEKGEGWEETTIGEACVIVNGYAFKSGDFASENEIRSIKITNVGVAEFVEDTSSCLPQGFQREFSKVAVPSGSLVVALTRTIIADGLKVAVVPKAFGNALLNQRVAALLFDADDAKRDCVYFYLQTLCVSDYVREKANTLMQPNLSIGDLRTMPLPVPVSPVLRKHLVSELNTCREEQMRMVEAYQKKLIALDELKQSILQKAFTGRLTEKAPELEAVG